MVLVVLVVVVVLVVLVVGVVMFIVVIVVVVMAVVVVVVKNKVINCFICMTITFYSIAKAYLFQLTYYTNQLKLHYFSLTITK